MYPTDPVNDCDLDGTESWAEKCRKKAAEIRRLQDIVNRRQREYDLDALGLKQKGKNSRQGHLNALNKTRVPLDKALAWYRKYCGGSSDRGPGPTPSPWTPPTPSLRWEYVAFALGLAALAAAGGRGGDGVIRYR